MVIRVRVKLKGKGEESIEASAIANSGYESPDPEIVVPESLAEKLSLFPELPSGAKIEEYRSIGGVTRIYYVPDAIEISIITARAPPWATPNEIGENSSIKDIKEQSIAKLNRLRIIFLLSLLMINPQRSLF